MGAERTLRRPKRPRVYAAVIALAALVLGASVLGTWRQAQRLDQAPEGLLAQGVQR